MRFFSNNMLSLGSKISWAMLTTRVGIAAATQALGLHEAAVARGKLYFGTATHNQWYNADAAYRTQTNNVKDFGQIVPTVTMKMDATQPRRGVF